MKLMSLTMKLGSSATAFWAILVASHVGVARGAALSHGAARMRGSFVSLSSEHYDSKEFRAANVETSTLTAHGGQEMKRNLNNRTEPEEEQPDFPDDFVVSKTRTVDAFFFVKCAIDLQTKTRIWYHKETNDADVKPMTPQVCFDFCQNITGVQFFGLVGGKECYCTVYFQEDEESEPVCDKPCEGDRTVMCGGSKASDLYEMHDHNNMPASPCKRPPGAVENAIHFRSTYYRKGGSPCKNAVDKPLDQYNSHCDVVCQEGYDLVKNTFKCAAKGDPLTLAWSQMEGLAACEPKNCGRPKDLPHARFPKKEVLFPNSVSYTCQLGYSLDGQASGATTQTSSCLSSGQFENVTTCKPVSCGQCPFGKDELQFATPEGNNSLVFEQRCSYKCFKGYTLDQQAMGVASFKTRCLAFGNFSQASECMPVSCGPSPAHEFAAFKDGVNKGESAVYKNVLSYECNVGYTLNGLVSGERSYQITCQDDGHFTTAPRCQPVKCGKPAKVVNAVYEEAPLVYLQTVTYTCDFGYTMTGKAGDQTQTTIACGSDGQFEESAPRCLPVVCGKAPVLGHAALSGKVAESLNFESPELVYDCNPGFSTALDDDPWTPKSTSQSTKCGADGKFPALLPCVNIDDCRVHSCGTPGTCVDAAQPTGIAFDDYSCKCDAGHEQTLTNLTGRPGELEKICTNINDCPRTDVCGGETDSGSIRGQCQDLLLNYTCLCSSGYELKTRTDLPKNLTCTPVSCGALPSVANASAPLDKANYDTPPWKYTCDTGHSLDGLASGTKDFEVRCQSSATFSPLQVCLPVSCGALKTVDHAAASPMYAELFFPDVVKYSCGEGFSLDKKASGTNHFEVSCQADGKQTALSTCYPVECGKTPKHEQASYDTERIFTYREQTEISCDEGYSLDQTTAPESARYSLPCLSTGKFATPQTCKPVLCGAAPAINHTSRNSAAKVFKDKVTYTLDDGYTLDGTAEGKKSFVTECKADASFSAAARVLPVSCGVAPPRPNAVSPGTSHVYLEKAHFTCLDGFSLDGEAAGQKSFSLECTARGSYVGPAGCQPVKCGSVTKPAHTEQLADDEDKKLKQLVFGKYAQFKCNPGYSKDGVLHSTAVFGKVQCQSNGELLYPPPCINNDDCVSPENQCSANGECEDKPSPTGEHMKDFHCKCDSGFAENKTDVSRSCYNVPDCPAAACLPGSCHDLVNDYKCVCPDGYYVGASPEKNMPHDCLPVSCGSPPEVEHARPPPSAEMFFDSPPVEYQCKEGYTLDGAASGDVDFNLACLENKSFQAPPKCLPVACGAVPHVQEAEYDAEPLVYPKSVEYTCKSGYSLDAKFGEGNVAFSSECRANGTYTAVQECLPIKCPPVPPQPHTSADHGGANLVYSQSVEENCADGYALTETPGSKASYTITCNERGGLDYSEGAKRCRPISCGALPEVDHATTEGGHLFGESAVVRCDTGYSVDQTTAPASGSYTVPCQSNGAFSATKPCKPVLCPAMPIVGNATSDPDSGTSRVFQETVTYTLAEGFTLSGQVGGTTTFEISCLADATYSPTQTPQPVSCGVPAPRAHASHPGLSRVYPQIEPVTCVNGYSIDGMASGRTRYELRCQANGKYAAEADCKPVECGGVVVPANSAQVADSAGETLAELVFKQKASFKCKPGFSLSGVLTGPVAFTTRCQADGAQSAHEGCLNNNDCEGHMCGPNGKCVDHENPTGVHKDDYHCNCNPGFEEEVKADGTRICGNVPDCPEGACLPGSCHDLVNDYKCTCPEGYFEGPNEGEDLKHDCMPVSCGPPPKVAHATTQVTGKVLFDHEPVAYTCEEGYTLDGAAGGEDSFALKCLASEKFEAPPKCVPVRCGMAASVEHSSYDAERIWTYSEKVPYTCADGYSVDGTAAGAKTFKATCQADGELTGVQACQPVACPSAGVSFGQNATFDAVKSESMVFPEQLLITCIAGHALHKDQHAQVTYLASCQKDGKIFVPQKACTPIDCGMAPVVTNAKVTGSTRFGGDLFARANAGYSLDGSIAKAASEFKIGCAASGGFVGLHEFQRVSCGEAPTVEHTSKTAGAKLFGDKITYTLDAGYSLDGTSSGARKFETTCLANGTFSPARTPLPVSCGSPPAAAHATSDSVGRVFQEKAIYACEGGYSTDGSAAGPKSFEIVCLANGQFSTMQKCQPISCGAFTTPVHATQVADADGQQLKSLVFGRVAKFNCAPGFSRDGILGSELTSFTIQCLASGEMYYPSQCQNIDDCASQSNQCSSNGRCVDLENPTGVHRNDFRCECSSGFAEKRSDEGVRTCDNIPDCPAGACMPGGCHDLVNDYECSCPAGYYVGPNAAEDLRHDCLPVSCGNPPQVDKAALENHAADKAVVFDEPPIEYTCEKGYTLDGTASGEITFRLSCQANASFEASPRCLPVSCGSAPARANANYSEGERTFSETVRYTCNSGYSTTGQAGGQDFFDIACAANGSYVSPSGQAKECLPVACKAEDFTGEHAIVDSTALASLVFPQSMVVKCQAGYSVGKDDHSRKQYEISCDAQGKLVEPELTCVAMDCGSAPEVPHATVTGSTRFGSGLVATAHTGYTLDGTAGGLSSFNISCLASGSFSELKVFQRIRCEHVPQVEHVMDVALHEAGAASALLQSSDVPSRRAQPISWVAHQQQVRQQRRVRQELPEPRYNDQVMFTCMEGYRATPSDATFADVEGPVSFDMTCEASGQLQTIEHEGGDGASLACTPVACDVPPAHGDAIETPIRAADAPRPVFMDEVQFTCRSGFSTDGTPNGASAFVKTCQADGFLSEDTTCKDIDWCLLSQCGDHGSCVDGELSYTCTCNAGYKAVAADGAFETCVQIDECDTQGGNDLCSGGVDGAQVGVCKDGLSKYACECGSGYDNSPFEVVDDSGKTLNLDSCAPVICREPVPEVENGVSELTGQKIAYLQSASFACNVGHSLDGSAAGDKDFVVSCEADRSLKGVSECKPVDCGELPKVEKSTSNVSSLVFGKHAGYACAAGYTTTGHVDAESKFTVTCTETGALTELATCKPVSCGMSPKIHNAESNLAEMVFGQSTKYDCKEGHTVSGSADGKTSFTVSCAESGKFTGIEPCLPVSCGAPEKVEHSQMPLTALVYPQQFEGICDSGHTISGKADGDSTFVGQCTASGKIVGTEKCLPVECPVPPATNASAMKTPKVAVFGDLVPWQCKEGYSVNGMKDGLTGFDRTCGSDGKYEISDPSDCQDIDFCHGNPCGVHGVCQDSGTGVPAPGYSCECFEGFEVKKRSDGSEKCSADDCAGDPCGDGGACTDLSKAGGAQGTYMCECDVGYELVEEEKGKPICRRAVCGALPESLANVVVDPTGETDFPFVVVNTFRGEAAETDALHGTPILRSFDVATYQCAEGYSTDGTTSPESKKFTLECASHGSFSRQLSPQECQPVRCDNYALPSVPNTDVIDEKENFYEYGDSVHFRCVEGHTLGGELNAEKDFQLPCQKDGRFPDPPVSCLPVACHVPELPNSRSSASELVLFGTTVSFSCFEGYSLSGQRAGEAEFAGVCSAEGEITFTVGGGVPTCAPIQCGMVPGQANADLLVSSEWLATRNEGESRFIAVPTRPRVSLAIARRSPVRGMELLPPTAVLTSESPVVRVQCKSGYTVGGASTGATAYQMECQSTGEFTEITRQCEAPMFLVEGEVTDAQSARDKLEGVKVVYSAGGRELATATTDGRGTYRVRIPAGDLVVSATLEGYIDMKKGLKVAGNIGQGQGGDLALSKVLPEGEWRVVLDWGKHSRDLDSHTLFGSKHVAWYAKEKTDRSSGISAVLDRDDVNGYGPETTTLKNIGRCKPGKKCFVYFKVHNWTPYDGPLGSSKGKITVYEGNHVAGTFTVPQSVGADRWYTVFTLDATEHNVRLMPGSVEPYPELVAEDTGVADWRSSFDWDQWSVTPEESLLYDISSSSEAVNLHHVDFGHYYNVRNAGEFECKDQRWRGLLEGKGEKWATCSEGYFLAGFYRTGHKYDRRTGPKEISKAKCCKPKALPTRTQNSALCTEVPAWEEGCPLIEGRPSAMVGLHKRAGSDDTMKAIDLFKCCSFPPPEGEPQM
eukprot:TRINITY_DN25697_c0_g2_i1.p1 TRINITY_DN25697_c0_g2~~TRINITY_DN25697_c0_g2_i1.p1  ORF type:complete len:4096 (+),score=634.51 TRINITY_DN25697_c0_g2_i1:84-12290(+)